MYDKERIERIVSAKRNAFYKRIGAIGFLMLTLLVIALINTKDSLTFICLAAELPMMLLLGRVFSKHHAKTLLCREIKGKNIKEYEYGIQGDGQARIYRRGIVPNNYSNRKTPPLRLNGTVYLLLDDGNIASVSGLYKSHMDIYEDGDILIRYAGTKFPVVLSREAKKQPCPICGEVNDMSLDECRCCGLTIIKKRG